MKPVEGTILTVIRETSEKLNELDNTTDINQFW
ncbi:kinase, partial [Mycoplasma putrefaciens]